MQKEHHIKVSTVGLYPQLVDEHLEDTQFYYAIMSKIAFTGSKIGIFNQIWLIGQIIEKIFVLKNNMYKF